MAGNREEARALLSLVLDTLSRASRLSSGQSDPGAARPERSRGAGSTQHAAAASPHHGLAAERQER